MGGRLRKMEELRKTLPQLQGHQPRILGAAIDRAVDGGTDIVHIVLHGPADAIGLGERCGTVIKINRTQDNPSFFSQYITVFDLCHEKRSDTP